MLHQETVDSLSIVSIFALFAVVGWLFSEGGFRLGRWRQLRTPDEKEGPTGMIVGSLLALMAFLLAITMGMASDRFDSRRSLVLAEANSVGTTYLRAGYLAEPASSKTRSLLREYMPLRIENDETGSLEEKIAKSEELHDELWEIAQELARTSPESNVLSLYIESLNEMIDLHQMRIMVGIYGRVPEAVLFLLFFGSLLTLAMVGFTAGLTQRRSPLTPVVLIFLLGAVITLVIDLDRPQDGFLTVNERALIDLQEQIERQ